MLQYKILYFDANGALLYTGRMEDEGDEAAIERAGALHHAHDVEIWRDTTLLRRFERVRTR